MKTKRKFLYTACMFILFICGITFVACGNSAKITSYMVKLATSEYTITGDKIVVSYGKDYKLLLKEFEITATFDDQSTKTIQAKDAEEYGFSIKSDFPDAEMTPVGNYIITISNADLENEITINVEVEPKMFDLTLMVDGIEYGKLSVEWGKTAKLPSPDKQYYTFDGWYDANFENEFTSSMPVSSNMTLCAKFTAITYPISYENVNNVSNANPQTYTVATGVTLSNLADRLDYKFVGWFTDSTYETGITEVEVGHTGGLTLYAKWEQKDEFKPFTYSINQDGQTITITGLTAQDKTGITSLTIPSVTTKIGNQAFMSCSELLSITIPDSVTSIGTEAFRACTALTQATLSKNLRSLGNGAFRSCSALASISVPDGVVAIGASTFRYCSALKSVVLGKEIDYILDEAFTYCSKLESLTIGGEITSISSKAFISPLADAERTQTNPQNISLILSVNQKELQLGNNGFYEATTTKHTSQTSFCGSVYKSIEHNVYLSGVTAQDLPTELAKIDFSSPVYLVFAEDAGADIFGAFKNYLNNFQDGSVSIGINGVKDIPENVFNYCKALKNVYIGNRVSSIGSGAFYKCSLLESIDFGSSLKTIGYNAFYGCASLKSINIPNNVTTLGHNSFHSCNSLQTVKIGTGVETIEAGTFVECSNLTSVVIANAKIIKGQALSSCDKLLYIVLGDALKTIEYDAFMWCFNLIEVYYTGTPEQWSEIVGTKYLGEVTVYYQFKDTIASGVNYWIYGDNGEPTKFKLPQV